MRFFTYFSRLCSIYKLQTIACVPCVAQCILVACLTRNSLYLPHPYHSYVALPPLKLYIKREWTFFHVGFQSKDQRWKKIFPVYCSFLRFLLFVIKFDSLGCDSVLHSDLPHQIKFQILSFIYCCKVLLCTQI